MLTRINTAVFMGVQGYTVTVETNLLKGIPKLNLVGLPSATVLEARERIRAAIANSGFEFPRGKITVNLTPANIRKNGTQLDLPIAVGLLTMELNVDHVKAEAYGILGELSLDGHVLGVDGILPMVMVMADSGIKKIIVPVSNYTEASMVEGVEIIPVDSLAECAAVINGALSPRQMETVETAEASTGMDFSQIHGQENAKRAIAIAVCGGHGLLMVGSPGCGKTMLARRIPTIMPAMTSDEILETSIIYSVSGKLNLDKQLVRERPFRAPHSSIGIAGLIGGGSVPMPGELSLAHNGVLFLDEVGEFTSAKIDALRIPMEDRHISHFRNGQLYRFPCSFELVMATNPCKCGYFGSTIKLCTCSQRDRDNYRRRLSGPIMDRIDLKLEMETVEYKELTEEAQSGMDSAAMAELVAAGREFARRNGRSTLNANMEDADIVKYCSLGEEESHLMKQAYSRLKLSPRAYIKVLKVARTIADMEQSERIRTEHLAEALSYRIYSDSEE